LIRPRAELKEVKLEEAKEGVPGLGELRWSVPISSTEKTEGTVLLELLRAERGRITVRIERGGC
jgi:hypothetical protein